MNVIHGNFSLTPPPRRIESGGRDFTMYSSDGYKALREASAVVRRGDRGVLQVTGPDRLVWLQGLLTNDVGPLGPGESCYAAYLTPQGRMISDMRVVNDDDRTLLEVPGPLAGSLRARLDALLFSEDAQIADVSGSTAVLDVHGPHASLPASVTAMATIRNAQYGVPSITAFLARSDEAAAVHAVIAGGAIETTLETLDVIRIESGTPLFLVDMDEHTIPLEAGIESRAISFTKGCYVGQEVIVRVTQRGGGRVAKKLVGLLLPKDSPAHPGDTLRAGERDIGRVTSAVWSPALERPIALGYVHRDFQSPGTFVELPTAATATVTSLPFV
jgi:folate-binding protein YgfZ